MGKVETITIEQLAKELARQVKLGNGKKKILISGDDEGNSYHEMFFLVSKVEDCISSNYKLPWGVTAEEVRKNYVILG